MRGRGKARAWEGEDVWVRMRVGVGACAKEMVSSIGRATVSGVFEVERDPGVVQKGRRVEGGE